MRMRGPPHAQVCLLPTGAKNGVRVREIYSRRLSSVAWSKRLCGRKKVCVWLRRVLSSSYLFLSLFFSRIKTGVSYIPLPLKGSSRQRIRKSLWRVSVVGFGSGQSVNHIMLCYHKFFLPYTLNHFSLQRRQPNLRNQNDHPHSGWSSLHV